MRCSLVSLGMVPVRLGGWSCVPLALPPDARTDPNGPGVALILLKEKKKKN